MNILQSLLLILGCPGEYILSARYRFNVCHISLIISLFQIQIFVGPPFNETEVCLMINKYYACFS